MSYLYDGLAAVAVIARYLLRAPVERTTLNCPIRVSDAGAGRVRIELQEYLHGPTAANLLHVILIDGRSLQGQIVDGYNSPHDGWLLVDVGQCELTLEPSTSLSRWRWA